MVNDQSQSSTESQASKFNLQIPEEVRYNCQGCGRCCSGWSVGLTETDYDKVKDIDWGSLHPQLAERELFIHRQEQFKHGQAQYPHFTNPRKDGTCPFLIDNLCFIHGHLGEEQKPGTCQIFPYSYVETPTGFYMGLAYNSMA
ncbi:MAG: YkgJ family cysteine cluster protein, partial [Candidatus Obscuribacterales bacterium]|nr:YkgJ family cysteine cluster protein [Candidatus Obscuribacterales bacterium]